MSLNPPLTLPFIFVNGTIIDATQVNADFAAITSQLNTALRTVLTQDATFYVAPGGVDAPGNGLSIVSPAATIQYIIDLLQAGYDLNWRTATIQLANGSYNQSTSHIGSIPGLQAAARLVIQGNMASPNLVTWVGNPCLNCSNGALVSVQGMTLQSAASQCVIAQTHSRVLVSNVIFGTTLNSHMLAARGASIQVNGNYTIAGGGASHLTCFEAGEIFCDPPPGNYTTAGIGSPTVTLTGTPNFSNAFALCNATSIMKIGAVFAGTGATGVRYKVNYNSVVNTQGQGANYLPGDQAGVLTQGGQYV